MHMTMKNMLELEQRSEADNEDHISHNHALLILKLDLLRCARTFLASILRSTPKRKLPLSAVIGGNPSIFQTLLAVHTEYTKYELKGFMVSEYY
jgi:hypothetical protein